MTWGITTMPSHGWRKPSVSSEGLTESGRQRMRPVWKTPWITWPLPVSRCVCVGSGGNEAHFYLSQYNVLHHFLICFVFLGDQMQGCYFISTIDLM